MTFYQFEDQEHIKRERRKAQELRQSSWWKQQVGRGVCYYCGEKFPKQVLTMDHVLPIARGGKTSKKNCVVCCKNCNTKKGHHLPVELTLETMADAGSESDQDSGD
jgi:5-methylcytosine-specific restriction protein A